MEKGNVVNGYGELELKSMEKPDMTVFEDVSSLSQGRQCKIKAAEQDRPHCLQTWHTCSRCCLKRCKQHHLVTNDEGESFICSVCDPTIVGFDGSSLFRVRGSKVCAVDDTLLGLPSNVPNLLLHTPDRPVLHTPKKYLIKKQVFLDHEAASSPSSRESVISLHGTPKHKAAVRNVFQAAVHAVLHQVSEKFSCCQAH